MSIDEFKVSTTLGRGFSSEVKLATDSDGKQYALKIFNLSDDNKNEIKTMLFNDEYYMAYTMSKKKLIHENIVKYYYASNNSTMKSPDGKDVPIAYLV